MTTILEAEESVGGAVISLAGAGWSTIKAVAGVVAVSTSGSVAVYARAGVAHAISVISVERERIAVAVRRAVQFLR